MESTSSLSSNVDHCAYTLSRLRSDCFFADASLDGESEGWTGRRLLDSGLVFVELGKFTVFGMLFGGNSASGSALAVSYTHLTLPTMMSV